MFRRLAVTAVLAVAGTMLAAAPANAGDPLRRSYNGSHYCCSGGMYLRSTATGEIRTTGTRYFGITDLEWRVWDRREDGMCARVWLQAWSHFGVKLVDTTGTDCDSDQETSAVATAHNGLDRAAKFVFKVGRIRHDGYIDYTTYTRYLPGT